MKATIHQQFHPSFIVDKKFHPIPHEQGGTKKYEYVAKKLIACSSTQRMIKADNTLYFRISIGNHCQTRRQE